MKALLAAGLSLLALAGRAEADDIMVTKAVPVLPGAPSGYDWSGFYAGGHLGVAWGSSNWTASTPGAPAPFASGSFSLFEPINSFSETGSFLDGMQAGYNYMLPSRFVVGAEADASFPSFQNHNGISIGGTSTLLAPAIGAESFSATSRYSRVRQLSVIKESSVLIDSATRPNSPVRRWVSRPLR